MRTSHFLNSNAASEAAHSYAVLSSPQEVRALLPKAKPMARAKNVLMVSPKYFHIDNPINPHMQDKQGNKHVLNFELAQRQWLDLKNTYQHLGLNVSVVEGAQNLPDMVFCANQCLPNTDDKGNRSLLKSNMANDTRHLEVPFIASHLANLGYKTQESPARTEETRFEGMGDCLWIPGKRFLVCGVGPRTSLTRMHDVAQFAEAPLVYLELVHPRFYHLDTCLCVLSEKAAMACRAAFSKQGWEILQSLFATLIEVETTEADSPLFACNAHCPDEKHVILQRGSLDTESKLRASGFVPVDVESGEFIKSGGSVFCMKLMYF